VGETQRKALCKDEDLSELEKNQNVEEEEATYPGYSESPPA
jgi:hypothetical protein